MQQPAMTNAWNETVSFPMRMRRFYRLDSGVNLQQMTHAADIQPVPVQADALFH